MKWEHGHKQLEYKVNKRWTGFINRNFHPFTIGAITQTSDLCGILVTSVWPPSVGSWFVMMHIFLQSDSNHYDGKFSWPCVYMRATINDFSMRWWISRCPLWSERTYNMCVKLTVLSRFLEVSSAAYTSPRLTPQQEPRHTRSTKTPPITQTLYIEMNCKPAQ